MAHLLVIGGTGYAGSNIVTEALARGHQVTVLSRKPPVSAVAGADYRSGSVADVTDEQLAAPDVVAVALSPRGDMEGRVRPAVADLAARIPAGTRLGVVGGAGGTRVAPDGPLLADTPEFPDFIQAEAREMIGVLDDLKATPETLDWFLINPAAGFIGDNPGERTGRYRDGGEVLVTGENGESYISGPDFAVAFVDEIERPTHHRRNFAVGY